MFGTGNNPGISPRKPFSFLRGRKGLSQCVVVCSGCGREIMSIDDVARTPHGRVMCDGCAQDNYLDVPLA